MWTPESDPLFFSNCVVSVDSESPEPASATADAVNLTITPENGKGTFFSSNKITLPLNMDLRVTNTEKNMFLLESINGDKKHYLVLPSAVSPIDRDRLIGLFAQKTEYTYVKLQDRRFLNNAGLYVTSGFLKFTTILENALDSLTARLSADTKKSIDTKKSLTSKDSSFAGEAFPEAPAEMPFWVKLSEKLKNRSEGLVIAKKQQLNPDATGEKSSVTADSPIQSKGGMRALTNDLFNNVHALVAGADQVSDQAAVKTTEGLNHVNESSNDTRVQILSKNLAATLENVRSYKSLILTRRLQKKGDQFNANRIQNRLLQDQDQVLSKASVILEPGLILERDVVSVENNPQIDRKSDPVVSDFWEKVVDSVAYQQQIDKKPDPVVPNFG